MKKRPSFEIFYKFMTQKMKISLEDRVKRNKTKISCPITILILLLRDIY